MTFAITRHPIPEAIGRIAVEIVDPEGMMDQYRISASILLTDGLGQTADNWNGDLIPHLPAEQRENLIAFLEWLRAEADAKLLG